MLREHAASLLLVFLVRFGSQLLMGLLAVNLFVGLDLLSFLNWLLGENVFWLHHLLGKALAHDMAAKSLRPLLIRAASGRLASSIRDLLLVGLDGICSDFLGVRQLVRNSLGRFVLLSFVYLFLEFGLLGGDGLLSPVTPPAGFAVPKDTPFLRDVLSQWFSARESSLRADQFLDPGTARWNLPAEIPADCVYHGG